MSSLHYATSSASFSSPHFAPEQESRPHFERWGYQVHGWFKTPLELESRPGVLLVSTLVGGLATLIDVIDAEDVQAQSFGHARAREWRKHASGGILFAAIYLDHELSSFMRGFLRESTASQIRTLEHPICGARDVLA